MKRASISMLFAGSLGVALAQLLTPVPPDLHALRGTWVGFTSEANDFYRVRLDADGGSMAAAFAGREPRLSRITALAIDSQSRITMDISPISTNAYAIRVGGSAETSRLQLRVTGPDTNGWVHDILLYREDLLLGRIAALRSAMERPPHQRDK